MNRRDFFAQSLTALPALAAVTAGVGMVASGAHDGYQPAGLIEAGTLEAARVDYITLDGKRIDSVTECNDVEGWLRHYEWDGPKYAPESLPRTVYRTGTVRVHWRPPS